MPLFRRLRHPTQSLSYECLCEDHDHLFLILYLFPSPSFTSFFSHLRLTLSPLSFFCNSFFFCRCNITPMHWEIFSLVFHVYVKALNKASVLCYNYLVCHQKVNAWKKTIIRTIILVYSVHRESNTGIPKNERNVSMYKRNARPNNNQLINYYLPVCY